MGIEKKNAMVAGDSKLNYVEGFALKGIYVLDWVMNADSWIGLKLYL